MTYTFDETALSHRAASRPVHPIFLSRRSLRSMAGTRIAHETLLSLLEAARWTPSHYNVQNWRFIYVTRDNPAFPQYLDTLWELNRAWAQGAAVLVAVVSKKTYIHPFRGDTVHLETHSFEAGAAFMALSLEGVARGLVVHAMGGFEAGPAKAAFGLPEDEADYHLKAIVAIGHPTEATAGETTTGRNEVESFLSEGKFSEKLPIPKKET